MPATYVSYKIHRIVVTTQKLKVQVTLHRVSALDYRFYLSGDETRENFELLSKART